MASAIGDIWEHAISLREFAEVGEVVCHHKVTAAPDSDTQDVAEAILNALVTCVTEIMTVANRDSVTCNAITTRRVAGPSGTTRLYSRFPTIEGGLESGNSMPAQTALLIAKYTETNTGSGRGRMYWPFINSTLVNSGQVNQSQLLTLDGKFEMLLLDAFELEGTVEADPCVYSRALSTGEKITDIVVRPVLATQQRRVVYKQPAWNDA